MRRSGTLRWAPATTVRLIVGSGGQRVSGAGVGRARVAELSSRLRSRARRPEEIVEATRWLFAVLVGVSLLLALPPLVATASAPMLLVGLVSSVVIELSWGAGYLRRSAPLGTDVVDAVAMLGIALACPQPIIVAVGFVVPALWFRSLYGSTRRALVRCGLYIVALSASLPLWPYFPGHSGGTELAPLVGVVPAMFLTVIVGRHLAGSLRAREQAARWDALHMSVGSQLLAVTDAAEIRRIAWAGISGICAATPGLRVLKVVRDGATLRVDRATDGFVDVPATLPATVGSLIDGDAETGRDPVHRYGALNAAAGTRCAWACLPLPSEPTRRESAWLILGCPRTVPAEAVASVASLANQVTLALLNAQVHQELRAQARLDSLTGLANRASFNDALSASLDDETAGHTTVLFVDLDDFKDVNDALGHAAGDDLLREVAARLRRATRPEDLCARLGGDEFAVLLRGSSGAAAAEVAQRIVHAVADPAHLGAGVAHVAASVGVATATSETGLEELIHRADVAMYAAKAGGKDRFQVFETGLRLGDLSPASSERRAGRRRG